MSAPLNRGTREGPQGEGPDTYEERDLTLSRPNSILLNCGHLRKSPRVDFREFSSSSQSFLAGSRHVSEVYGP